MSGQTRYLFDTNLVSETRKPKPDPGAFAFLQATEALVLKPKETSVDDAVKMMTNYVSTQLDLNKAEARK